MRERLLALAPPLELVSVPGLDRVCLSHATLAGGRELRMLGESRMLGCNPQGWPGGPINNVFCLRL